MYILRGRNTGPSSRALVHDLTRRGIHPRIIRVMDEAPPSAFVVNWSGQREPANVNASTSSDKLRQLEVWRDAQLNVPGFSREWVHGWFPRSRYHRGGRDFDGGPQLSDYWTEPIPSRREWRMHMLRDGASYYCGRIGRKVQAEVTDEPYPIRSRRHGWRIQYYATTEPWIHKLPRSFDYGEAVTQAGWAIMTQGWDMGAVDLLEGRDGKITLLEANACPGLNDAQTAAVYGSYIEKQWRYGRWMNPTLT